MQIVGQYSRGMASDKPRARHGQQRHTGERHRNGAEGPNRNLAHCKDKERPVGAPYQGQHNHQDDGAARNGVIGHGLRLPCLGAVQWRRAGRMQRRSSAWQHLPARLRRRTAPSGQSTQQFVNCALLELALWQGDDARALQIASEESRLWVDYSPPRP